MIESIFRELSPITLPPFTGMRVTDGGGGWGGGWGGVGTGMLMMASHEGCRAWHQQFSGWPGQEGACEHLARECRADSETLFKANTVYWVDGFCVHESVPMAQPTDRQFVRLSLPSLAPWFEGYTVNSKGVRATGAILPRREFMDF